MQSDPHSPSPQPPAPAEPGRDTPDGMPGALAAPGMSTEVGVPVEPAAPTSNGFPSNSATADHTPSLETLGVENEAPPAEATAEAAQELDEQPAPPRARYNPFRYWLRPIVLAVLVLILLGL